MCPVCIATIAQMVAGATSTGGVTALVVKLLRVGAATNKINLTSQSNGGHYGSSAGRAAS
jgi:hypothetical protein